MNDRYTRYGAATGVLFLLWILLASILLYRKLGDDGTVAA